MSGDPQDPKDGPDAAFTPTPEAPAPGWVTSEQRIDVGPGEPQSAPVEQLGDAITRASHDWLKDRFGLVEDAAGELHIPDAQRWPDLGARAEQFLRGFLGGIVARTPEEHEVASGQRDAADVPRGTEVLGRLLSRFSNTVTDTWTDFVAARAARESDDGKKVVDGEFIMQHGATLIGTMLSRLGEAFQDVGVPGGTQVGPDFGTTGPTAAAAAAPASADAGPATQAGGDPAVTPSAATPDVPDAADPSPAPAAGATAPKIKVEIDLGSIVRSFFSPRR